MDMKQLKITNEKHLGKGLFVNPPDEDNEIEIQVNDNYIWLSITKTIELRDYLTKIIEMKQPLDQPIKDYKQEDADRHKFAYIAVFVAVVGILLIATARIIGWLLQNYVL